MFQPTLKAVEDVEPVKDALLPRGVSSRQLIITGPPGSGKSTEISRLGGWPEEGFLDLAHRRWWRSRALRFLPCEVHLGLPFQGHPRSLTTFDAEWLEAEPPPQVNLSRVYLPPEGKWLGKYVFGFMLPPSNHVFEAREERAYRQSHPVDLELSEAKIDAQIDTYRRVALHLHRAGLRVFVRDTYGGPPKVFETEMRGGGSPWEGTGRVRRPLVARLFESVSGTTTAPIVDRLDDVRLSGDKIRVPVEVLPIDLALGPQRLRVAPEMPLEPGDRPDRPYLRVFDPDEYHERISGFVRLGPGDRARIGKGAEDRLVTPRLPYDILPRLEIAYDGVHVSLIDLHSPGGTSVAPTPPDEADNLRRDALERLSRLGAIYGGPIEALPPGDALGLLRDVNRSLETQPYRPLDDRGRPGGLVELPIDLTPVLVGDLHAKTDNLLTVLSSTRVLDGLDDGSVGVVVLGDAVHPEEGDLADMDGSIVIMDLVLRLLLTYPQRFIYVSGNHDSFSPEVTKGGVPQGRVWEDSLREARGDDYVHEMNRFYERLPVIVASKDFAACHAGPPLEQVTRRRLIDLHRHPRLRHQLLWNRAQRAQNPGGYTKREVRALKNALDIQRPGPLIVAHTPEPGADTVWLDQAGIRGHHVVHSAHDHWVGTLTRLEEEIVPLVFAAQPCSKWTAPTGP